MVAAQDLAERDHGPQGHLEGTAGALIISKSVSASCLPYDR